MHTQGAAGGGGGLKDFNPIRPLHCATRGSRRRDAARSLLSELNATEMARCVGEVSNWGGGLTMPL